MKFIKKFFKTIFGTLLNEGLKGAYARVAFFTVLVMIVGFLFENNKWLDGEFLSDYMRIHFTKHANKEFSWPYIFYYAMLYLYVALYSVFSLYFTVKKNEVGWCGLVISISILFLVFMNAYLTIMLQITPDPVTTEGQTVLINNQSMYEMHMTSFISVATIMSAVSGIKMTYILGKNSHRNDNDGGKDVD